MTRRSEFGAGARQDRLALLATVYGQSAAIDMIAPVDHGAGDAQFLQDLPVGTCVLRPVLTSEVPDQARVPGTMMLVCRAVEGGIIRATVSMPPHRRRNNRANVRHAISKLARINEHLGEMFDELDRGVPFVEGAQL